jgi:hypothetical protein
VIKNAEEQPFEDAWIESQARTLDELRGLAQLSSKNQKVVKEEEVKNGAGEGATLKPNFLWYPGVAGGPILNRRGTAGKIEDEGHLVPPVMNFGKDYEDDDE